MLDQPGNANRDSIAFVIACVFLFAHILFLCRCYLFLGGFGVPGDRFLHRKWSDLLELYFSKCPCVQISHPNHLAQHLSLCRMLEKAFFSDLNVSGTGGDIRALLLSNFPKHFAVGFFGKLVIDVAFADDADRPAFRVII